VLLLSPSGRLACFRAASRFHQWLCRLPHAAALMCRDTSQLARTISGRANPQVTPVTAGPDCLYTDGSKNCTLQVARRGHETRHGEAKCWNRNLPPPPERGTITVSWGIDRASVPEGCCSASVRANGKVERAWVTTHSLLYRYGFRCVYRCHGYRRNLSSAVNCKRRVRLIVSKVTILSRVCDQQLVTSEGLSQNLMYHRAPRNALLIGRGL
jgi:hypothetical protein